MAEESEKEPRPGASPAPPAASWSTMGAASREAADAFLQEQTGILRLQRERLRQEESSFAEEQRLNLSHLRLRRFSDYGRFALEFSVGLVVVLIVGGLGAMVWNATQDRDLVVEAFSVPPDVAQTGMTGAVLAGRVLDRYGQMQADTVGTVQGAGSYRRDSANEVRVEIPNTGISLSEVNRTLRQWLGNETHVSGDLVRTAKGFALTTRYGAEPGTTQEDADLGKLIEKSAEHVYAAALPYRFAEYLTRHKRFAEAEALVPRLAEEGGEKDRALANSAWASLLMFEGDMDRAAQKGREAVRLDPENPVARAWLSATEGNLGHDEAARANAEASIRYWHGKEVAALDAGEAAWLPGLFAAYRDDADGDFPDALVQWHRLAASGWGGYDREQHAADHDIVQARAVAAIIAPKSRDGQPNFNLPLARFVIAWSGGDWAEALRRGREADAELSARPGMTWNRRVFVWPQLAYAMARTGDIAGAEKLIAPTPADCDICLRMRGRIAGLKRDWAGAARDFALVAARSPHTPYAETDWGATLTAKGDYDAAIAKFEIAQAKSPHFADPLEMWGEALMQKNRSDLALAKFAEANNYAPNWGRLHLEWGEALLYAGDKAGAQKQFAIAAHLELAASEKSALARREKAHG